MFSILKRNPVCVLVRKGWEFAGCHRGLMLVYFVMFLGAEATYLAEPYVIGRMLNTVQTDITGPHVAPMQIWHDLCGYLGIFFVLQVTFWAFHGPGRVIERFVAFHIKANYKGHLFRTVTQLPLQWHREHHSGENIDKINRATSSVANFFDSSFEFSYMVFRMVGSLTILFWFMPSAGLVGLGAAAASIGVIYLFDRYLYKQYGQLNKFENVIASAVHDYVTNIGSVITLRLESRVLREVQRRMGVALPLFRNNCTINELKWFLVTMVIAVMTVLVLCSYSYGVLSKGHMIMTGTFFTLFEYLRRIGESFHEFAWLYGTIVRQAADVESAETIVSALKTPADEGTYNLPDSWQTVSVSGLDFRYEDEKHREHHLVDVGIRLAKGKSIALVGESGSGKSTLLSLLRGVQAADAVKVECDGVLLPGRLRHLAPRTTLIPQEPEIFSDTIRFNITFGLEADEGAVMRAIELARFAPVLARLPNGLDTSIAEKGINLSGGEKQRLALARGIYFARDSDVVLLDEPTSSVDTFNERIIYDNLLREFADKCVVSSIHKLHLLELFDEIYVFDDGRLVEFGDLETLTCLNGALARMRTSYGAQAVVEVV